MSPSSVFLHPMLVHFPIVLLTALAFADHAAVLSGDNLGNRSCLPTVAMWLAVSAGIAAVIAFANGVLAYDMAVIDGTAGLNGGLHRDLAMVTAGLASLWAVVRGWLWSRDVALPRMWNILVAGASLGLAILVLVTALRGHALVLLHGVNVLPRAG